MCDGFLFSLLIYHMYNEWYEIYNWKDISLLFDSARKEANQALMENEVPIGSVIFNKDINEIIGSSHNRVQLNNNPFDHAEIIALREAMIKLIEFI